jgi:DNA polymerase III alpha subunit
VNPGWLSYRKSVSTDYAFVEWEDQIERCEVVLFPEVWKRSRSLIEKGALLALRAKVQQGDEGFELCTMKRRYGWGFSSVYLSW